MRDCTIPAAHEESAGTWTLDQNEDSSSAWKGIGVVAAFIGHQGGHGVIRALERDSQGKMPGSPSASRIYSRGSHGPPSRSRIPPALAEFDEVTGGSR